jgi:hypothetical protein
MHRKSHPLSRGSKRRGGATYEGGCACDKGPLLWPSHLSSETLAASPGEKKKNNTTLPLCELPAAVVHDGDHGPSPSHRPCFFSYSSGTNVSAVLRGVACNALELHVDLGQQPGDGWQPATGEACRATVLVHWERDWRTPRSALVPGAGLVLFPRGLGARNWSLPAPHFPERVALRHGSKSLFSQCLQWRRWTSDERSTLRNQSRKNSIPVVFGCSGEPQSMPKPVRSMFCKLGLCQERERKRGTY